MISLVLVLFSDLDDEIFAILWSLAVWACDYVLPIVAVLYILYCAYLARVVPYIWEQVRRILEIGLSLLVGLAGFVRGLPHGS